MKAILRTFLVASVVAIVAASALAGSIAGTWHGKIVLDLSKAPKPRNAQEQQQMNAAIAALKKVKLDVTFKANHTYSGHSTDPNGKTVTFEGKWTQTATSVTLNPLKHDGKP